MSLIRQMKIQGSSGNIADVNIDGQLHIVAEGKVDTGNSSATPINANISFVGTSIETLPYAVIVVSVFADVASATDGLKIEQSTDNSNWDHCDEYTIPANTGKTFSFQPQAMYLRITYINGGINQGDFRLQTTLKKTYVKPSSHRIQDSIIDEDDAELVKSVITGKNPSGTFVNFQATTAGNFKTSIEELENTVSVNSNTQLRTTRFDSSGNETPSMDVVGRAGFQKITDGTDTLDIVQNVDDDTNLNDTYGAVTNAVQYYRLDSSATVKSARMDASTHSLQTVDYAHHEIHSGTHYVYKETHAIAKNQTLDHLIIVPATTKWPHMIVDVENITSAITVSLYEGATVSANGVLENSRNRNRNFADNNTTLVYEAPTVLTTGALLTAATVGAGRNSAGGEIRDNEEMVLKQNTLYLLRIVEPNIQATTVNINFDWYEHSDKD